MAALPETMGGGWNASAEGPEEVDPEDPEQEEIKGDSAAKLSELKEMIMGSMTFLVDGRHSQKSHQSFHIWPYQGKLQDQFRSVLTNSLLRGRQWSCQRQYQQHQ